MSDTTSLDTREMTDPRVAEAGPGGPAAKPPLWIPSRERLRASNLVHFAAWLVGSGHDPEGGSTALSASVAEPSRDPERGPTALQASRAEPSRDPQRGYDALWRWSIEQQEGFWSALWDWCGMVGDKGERVFEEGDGMAGARYFPDARLNFAENLLRRRTDDPAIIAWAEDGRRRVVTWRELHDHTSRVAQAMRDAGLGPGDRVAALLPNVPEAVVVLLAATSIGAVLSTASPDFGVRGVIDRFGQVGPRLLLVTDGYSYRGKRYDTLGRVPAILEGLPTVERTVVVPNLGGGQAPTIPGAVPFDTFIRPFPAREIDFARLPFDHPLFILFSSGTTGVPKCIVHRAGGVLLQHIKEHQLHCDIKAGDRVFYFTTLGWMMWELAGFGAGVGGDDSALGRIARVPRQRGAVRFRRRHGHDPDGHLARLPGSASEVPGQPAREPRPVVPADASVHRLTPRRGGLRVRVPTHQEGRAPRVHLRRHRSLRLLRGRHSRPAGPIRRDPGPRPWHGHRCLCARRHADGRGQGRTGLHTALPVAAARVPERRRRIALPGHLLRAVPPGSGTTATTPRRRRREDTSSTAAPTRR